MSISKPFSKAVRASRDVHYLSRKPKRARKGVHIKAIGARSTIKELIIRRRYKFYIAEFS